MATAQQLAQMFPGLPVFANLQPWMTAQNFQNVQNTYQQLLGRNPTGSEWFVAAETTNPSSMARLVASRNAAQAKAYADNNPKPQQPATLPAVNNPAVVAAPSPIQGPAAAKAPEAGVFRLRQPAGLINAQLSANQASGSSPTLERDPSLEIQSPTLSDFGIIKTPGIPKIPTLAEARNQEQAQSPMFEPIANGAQGTQNNVNQPMPNQPTSQFARRGDETFQDWAARINGTGGLIKSNMYGV